MHTKVWCIKSQYNIYPSSTISKVNKKTNAFHRICSPMQMGIFKINHVQRQVMQEELLMKSKILNTLIIRLITRLLCDIYILECNKQFVSVAKSWLTHSSIAPFLLTIFPNSTAVIPVISSNKRMSNPKTSVLSEDWPVERYSSAMCPTVPRTTIVTWESA